MSLIYKRADTEMKSLLETAFKKVLPDQKGNNIHREWQIGNQFPAIVFARAGEERISTLRGSIATAVIYQIDIRSKDVKQVEDIDLEVERALSDNDKVINIEQVSPEIDDDLAEENVVLRARLATMRVS